MTTSALYEILTVEGDDGTTGPAEQLWAPNPDDAAGSNFISHRGIHVAGLDHPAANHIYPVAFVALGHQRWEDTMQAATALMTHVYGWRTLHLYPGDDPAVRIARPARAVHAHGVFLRHPHPDHPCGCEWDDSWRMVYAPRAELGAVPVTVMRHPAAAASDIRIPNPEDDADVTWAERPTHRHVHGEGPVSPRSG
ncbi:hypothetical protein ACTWJ8_40170 (plasmid) [Streptomyces sp. SDT5-1]|uniref:hypothetical protein n=1 Tax=Streptomyces sp. SDT5-1 TaxID=3406418 RepID=UPI003FD55BA3